MNREPVCRFTWNTHWACNYRCSYCFFKDSWRQYEPRNIYKNPGFWINRWDEIHEIYGRCYVIVTGGEPFTYPVFPEIILQISKKHWPINITTNASVNLDDFTAKADPAKISLSLSFHPQYHEPERFLALLSAIRRKGFPGCNNIVAYPPLLDSFPGILRRFAQAGHTVKINPFIGTYMGSKYPESYDPEEKKIMGMPEKWGDDKRKEGSMCCAGNTSALILPDGNVTRCGQTGDEGIFGNFFKSGFRLLDKPRPCNARFCPCDEWKTIPDESPAPGGISYLP